MSPHDIWLSDHSFLHWSDVETWPLHLERGYVLFVWRSRLITKAVGSISPTWIMTCMN